MNATSQRTAIATACGITPDPNFTLECWIGLTARPENLKVLCEMQDGCGKPSGRYRVRIPDYCNDLNAMHAAEQTLGDNGIRYGRQLWQVVSGGHDSINEGGNPFMLAHATAFQRAEAFLRCLNLWQD